MNKLLIVLLSLMLLVAACTSIKQPLNITREGEELVCGPASLFTNASKVIEATQTALSKEAETSIKQPSTTPEIKPSETKQEETQQTQKLFMEGQLAYLSPKVTDIDNDKVTLTFSAPLNSSGQWQTKKGDAGQYPITITATDGKATTTKQVLLIIKATDLPPVIEVKDKFEINEGEELKISPKVTDPENKQVTISFSAPLDKNGEWKAGFKDAGNYDITITASDGNNTVTKKVLVVVKNKNRAPVLEPMEPIVVKEGQLVWVKPKVTDIDNDKVTLTFSAPLNSSGQWQTKVGDAGGYTANITASDGQSTDKKVVSIVINKANKAPVIDYVSELTVNEGDKVVLTPKVTDQDGDKVDVIYTAPFNKQGEWQTSYTDAGTKEVIITANDSKEATTLKVKIIVKDKNRPPEIVV